MAPADEPNYVAVKVIGHGSGIPEHILPSIFDPFFTAKGRGKGTGLGLSMSQGIVTKHGGRILVSSIPGSGATFSVVLPIATIPAELDGWPHTHRIGRHGAGLAMRSRRPAPLSARLSRCPPAPLPLIMARRFTRFFGNGAVILLTR